jgi:tetratricopeptide (TPR) repeat protein
VTREVGNDLSGTVHGPTVQAGAIHGDVYFGGVAGPPPGAQDRGTHRVPRQLPAAPRHFTGRADALAALDAAHAGDAALGGAADPSDAPALALVSGPPGVGKTSLALTWLRRRREDFPDGQLYVDLRGNVAGRPPVAPSTVLPRFLHALGVPPEHVPAELAEQTALFRTVTADLRIAVLCDNALSAAQVRALAPAGGGSVCVVTSRWQLTSLLLDGAVMVPLEPLDADAAVELLGRIAGPERIAGDEAAAYRFVATCGRFPLAVCVGAALLSARPGWTVADVTADLLAAGTGAGGAAGTGADAAAGRAEGSVTGSANGAAGGSGNAPADGRGAAAVRGAVAGGASGRGAAYDAALDDEHGTGTEEFSMTASLDQAYAALPPDAARLYRRLGLHPGPEFAGAVAQAVAAARPPVAGALGTTGGAPGPRGAAPALAALVDANLLSSPRPGRYRFHDLIQRHALGRAFADDPEAVRAETVRRLLDHYMATADRADRVLAPQRHRPAPEFAEETPWAGGSGAPDAGPALPDGAAALAWFDAERGNLVAAQQLAVDQGLDTVAWQLADAMWVFFTSRRHLPDWITTHEVGAAAAHACGHVLGEARLRTGLGAALREAGRHREALTAFDRAVELRRAIGDRRGEAVTLHHAAQAHRALGDLGRAGDVLRTALALQDEAGAPRDRARAHAALGEIASLSGAHADALAHLTTAHALITTPAPAVPPTDPPQPHVRRPASTAPAPGAPAPTAPAPGAASARPAGPDDAPANPRERAARGADVPREGAGEADAGVGSRGAGASGVGASAASGASRADAREAAENAEGRRIGVGEADAGASGADAEVPREGAPEAEAEVDPGDVDEGDAGVADAAGGAVRPDGSAEGVDAAGPVRDAGRPPGDRHAALIERLLGEAYVRAGDDAAALPHLRAALEQEAAAGSAYEEALVHEDLAALAERAADPAAARDHYARAAALYRRLGALDAAARAAARSRTPPPA